MNNKKYLPALAVISIIASSLIITAPAFAAQAGNENAANNANGKAWGARMHARGVFGTVSAINGTNITVAGKTGPNGATGTTYNVDAANAKVTKGGASSSVSAIAVGDTVMVQGTISGSNITATAVRDGFGKDIDKNGEESRFSRQNMPAIQGNGQPVIGGAVTAINGSSLTITNKSNITYSVDASSAKVTKSGATSTLSSIATGDSVIVQGAVNGTSVTASSIVDQGNAANAQAQSGNSAPKQHFGFFGMIGGFFAHLFGF
ncbi:MAG TPA: DUF5666 domain-containing protein [Candidatus Paceibacterota bacterium]|nr:DUF5666 domain-containing protein [Candidatus Paceibacterota bacterium]